MVNDKIKTGNSFNLWRVVFTLVIMLFHLSNQYVGIYVTYPFIKYHWYVAVEFFFIMSGYLMAKHAESHPDETALQYTAGRIKRLYPLYILVLIMMVIWTVANSDINLAELIVNNWEEFFMLQSMGTGKFPYLNNPAWYVSAMFIAGHLIYYFLRNHKKFFIEFLGILSIICFLGIFIRDYDAINSFFSISSLGVSTGLLRAIFGLTIGIYIYYLSEKYMKNVSRLGGVIMTVLELGCFLTVIITSMLTENTLCDFVFLLLSAFGVFLASKNRILAGFSNCKAVAFLSKISYAMFLSHFFVLHCMGLIWESAEWEWILVPVYIIMTIVLSVILDMIVNIFMKNVINRNKKNA